MSRPASVQGDADKDCGYPPYPELLRDSIGSTVTLEADIGDPGAMDPELAGVPIAFGDDPEPFRLPADHPRFTYLRVLLAYASYYRYPVSVTVSPDYRTILDAAWIGGSDAAGEQE